MKNTSDISDNKLNYTQIQNEENNKSNNEGERNNKGSGGDNNNNNQGGNDDNNLDDEKLMNEISEQIDEIHKIRQEKKFYDFPLSIRDWKNNSLNLNAVLMTLHKMSCYLNSPMIIPLCKPWVLINVLYVGQNPNTGNIIAVYSECLIS